MIHIEIQQELLPASAPIREFVAVFFNFLIHLHRSGADQPLNRHARIDNDEGFEIQDAFDVPQSHIEQKSDPAW